MNLKKLGLPVVCCGAAFLTSCGYDFVQKKDLNYEDAKTWIKEKYGEGTTQGTIKKPSTVSSEWYIDGKVFGVASGDINDGTGYLKNHFVNFLNGYSYNNTSVIDATRMSDRDQTKGEFGFKTSQTLTVNAPENFDYYSLDEKHMDKTLNYFFKGAAKYGVTYRAYTNKTLEVIGNFYYSVYNTPNTGYDMLTLPYCSLTFNSDGSLKQFKFDFKGDAEGDYFWISAQKASYSGATYFTLNKGTKIEINFNY